MKLYAVEVTERAGGKKVVFTVAENEQVAGVEVVLGEPGRELESVWEVTARKVTY